MNRYGAVLSLIIAFVTAGGTAQGAGESLAAQPPPLTLALGSSPAKVDDSPRLDVRYDPSPPAVVKTMLSLGGVTKTDTLFDLGSGDGRIVITAAKKYGVRSTGIDLDPQRIEESRENARKAGVQDRVAFIRGDLFNVDISSATVVTLFLYDDVNIRLRPKLLRDLKPGTRVVSHEHDMDDWKPDRKVTVEGHNVYYWVIPANVGGTWQWGTGKDAYTLTLKQKFQNVTGALAAGAERIAVHDVQLKGDELSFTVKDRLRGLKTPARFSGKVEGNRISGTVTPKGGSPLPWEPLRDQATAAALDD
ncbi:MAG: class I SAM-dependent methyltransferase [Nitrospirota bacterium]